MSKTIITKKTLNPFVVELSDESVYDAQLYAENAGNISVYTGNTADDPEEASKTTITGSGLKAALKNVAGGATYVKDFSTGEWTYDKKGNPVPVKGSVSTIELNGGNHVTLNAVTVKGAIYGGALALTEKGKIATKYINGVTATVNGDVSLVLNNTNAKAVYGGGAGYGAKVNGNATISYAGGKVSNIYGGGYTGSVLNGDVAINIDADSSGSIGKIYAGGYKSTVNGSATVTFTGNSGNLKVGMVSGAGYGKNSLLTGDSTLVFDGYSGDFKATVKDFDRVVFSGDTSVTFTKGQNKTMKGATYEFVITDETLGLQGAMLTWNSKVTYANLVVSVETSSAIDVTLIESKKFKTANDFTIDSVLVVNADGEQLSSYAYELIYDYDRKLGGSVSISYKGQNLVFDSLETEKVVLSGAADEVSIVSGGNLAAGLSTGGGDDKVTLGSGAEMTGNIALGTGTNTLIVQKDAEMTGTIVFADDSTNTVTVNGAVLGFSGGNSSTSNTIVLNGDAIRGGGVGYWTEQNVLLNPGTGSEYWTTVQVFTVRDLDLTGGTGNDTVTLNNNSFVNNIYLGAGDDKLTVNKGANIGYDYVSSVVSTNGGLNFGSRIDATIDLGTGNDVLVLNTELGSNVNVISDDGGDVIVIGADMAINDNQLLVGSTNNTLVVANGRQVTFKNVASWGNFLADGARYDAFYLSQNAVVNFGDNAVIENYTGTMQVDDTLWVIGAPTMVPDAIKNYYTAGNGVENSELYADTIELENGAVITGSKVVASEVLVHAGTSIDNSKAGFVAVEDLIRVYAGASVKGTINLGYYPTTDLVSDDATAEIAGSVEAILGGTNNETVSIASDTASVGSIDLGAGNGDTVSFSSGTFSDGNLEIANTERIVLGDGADVTIGSAAGYDNVALGQNSKFTEIADQMVTIGSWNEAVSFADGYTVRLNGTVNADATLNNNTVLITDFVNYFAGNINLNGANTFSIQDNVHDWYDWQQFKFNAGATLGFVLGTESVFALDGFVDEDASEIVSNTTFGQNSGLALGDRVYIQDWDGGFRIANFQNIYNGKDYAPAFAFENLSVVAGAEIYGYIEMDNAANDVTISDGVVMNGATYAYDYAAILTLGGNDILTIGAATINGRIATGTGNDRVYLNGTVINTAINQAASAVELGDGDDEITLSEATVNGDVAFGAGADVLFSTGGNAVTGAIVFGAGDNTVEVLDGTLNAGGISFDGAAANNTIDINPGATFNLETPLELTATESNAVLVDAGELNVDGSVLLVGGENGVILSNGGQIAGLDELTMVGGENDLVLLDDVTGQTAGSVSMMGSDNEVFNVGTLNVDTVLGMNSTGDNRIENDGTLEIGDTLDMDAVGSNRIDNNGTLNAQTANLIAAEENRIENNNTMAVAGGLLMSAKNNGIANTGDFSADTLTMAGGVNANGIGGAAENTIETDSTFQVNNDVAMYGEENEIANAGTFTAGNVLLAGAEAAAGTLAAARNVIGNEGEMTAQSITMLGGTRNEINLGEVSTLTTADGIMMAGADNSVNAVSFYRVGYDTEPNPFTVPDADIVIDSDVTMKGGTNTFELGFETIANGIVPGSVPQQHLPAIANVGTVNAALNGTLDMEGDSNTANFAYFLIADQEGDVVVNGAADITAGDVNMRGSVNELNAMIYFAGVRQGVVDLGGQDSSLTLGDVYMDTDPVLGVNPAATRTNTMTVGHFEDTVIGIAGEIINPGTVSVAVGSIRMYGAGAANVLEIGPDTTFGAIEMGNVKGDIPTASNLLTLTANDTVISESIQLVAVQNTVKLQGVGMLDNWISIYGGANDVTVDADFVVNDIITFKGIYDQDHIGIEGYLIQENTANLVRLYGAANGIDSSLTNANDTFGVIGGLVTGSIVTGTSALYDVVQVGGVTQQNWDDGVLNARQASVVEGDVLMGGAKSTGTNTLNVISSVVVDADGNEIGFAAGINGDVAMASTNMNTLNVLGADTTPDAGGLFTRFEAVVGGSIDMTGSGNTAVLGKASVGEGISMIALTKENSLTAVKTSIGGDVSADALLGTNTVAMSGSSVAGSVSLTSGEDIVGEANVLTMNSSSIGGTVTMEAIGSNRLNAFGSTVGGDAAMTSGKGTNALDVISLVVADGDGNETGFAAGINGDVAMTSAEANTLNVYGADTTPDAGGLFTRFEAVVGGSIGMTGSGNTAVLKKASIGEGISMIALTQGNSLTAGETSIGGDVSADALLGTNTIAMSGSSVTGSVSLTSGEDIVGEANVLTMNSSSIGGSVTMDAIGSNRLNAFGSTVSGDTAMTSSRGGNILTGEAFDNGTVVTPSKFANVKMEALTQNDFQLSQSTAGNVSMLAADGFNKATVKDSETGSITMDAKFVDVPGATNNSSNSLTLAGHLTPAADPTQAAAEVVRSEVTGDVTMTAAKNNVVSLGTLDAGTGLASLTEFGSVGISGALSMTAAEENSIDVWAGTESSYNGGPSDGTQLDMRALVGSVAMSGQKNSIGVNQGALGVTAGDIAMTNLDKDGNVIAGASNHISVNNNSMLIFEENGGARQAITMGSKSVDFGTVTTNGAYGDIGYLYVSSDANGYETYYYSWHETTTTDPDTAAATVENTVSTSGKIYAGDLSMTGRTNSVTVTGPAVQDPVQNPAWPWNYSFDCATIDVGNVKMFGGTNSINVATTSLLGYDARLKAESVTMGDVEVVYASGTVKILAMTNRITSADNTYLNINGVDMTAANANTVDVGDYTRLRSANASDLVAGDGSLLVGNPGDYDANFNPHVKEIDDTTTNTLGNVTMRANGMIWDGTNTLNLGQNSTAADVDMTGYTNNVTLTGDTRATYYEVDPVTGLAVMDGLVQKTETVTLQNAAVIDDLFFHLPASMAGSAPTNTLTMGAGSTAASVRSTETWSVVVGAVTETYGAVDFIVMGERSTITGDVSLGYGNDVILMADGSEIAGSVDFGAGADVLSVFGAATVHAVDFGTNAPVGEALILNTNATLTVKGDITYKGMLNVFGAAGASIVFSDDFAFKSEGTDAKLIFNDLTTFGNINSQDIIVRGTLSVGNGTFSNGTMTFGSGSGTLNILPQKDADDQIIGATFEIADTAEVLFSDAGTWLYDDEAPLFGQPTVSDDVLNIAEDARLDLNGVLNFGTGANEINLAKSAIFNVNQAWETSLAAVNADGAAVDVDGKTESEVPAGTFVPLEDNTGSVGITMAHGSKLNAAVDVAAADGITLQGYYLAAAGADPEVIGSYTITGAGTITADIGVNNTAMAYKLDLSATVDGDVTFGAGADTLTVSADSEVNALTFGTGSDTLVLSGNLAATGLTYGGTLTVSGTGDVSVDTLTIGKALTTVDTVGWDVDTFTVNTTTVTGKLVLAGGDNDLTLNGATLSDGIDFGAGTDALTASTAASTIGGVSSTGTLTISGGDELLNFIADVTVQTGSVIFDLGSLSNGDTLMAFSGSSNNWTDLTSGDFDMVMDSNSLTTDQYVDLTSGFDLDMASWNMDADTKVLSDVSLKIGDTVISNFTYDSVNDWAIASMAGTETWKLKEEADGSLRLTYLA